MNTLQSIEHKRHRRLLVYPKNLLFYHNSLDRVSHPELNRMVPYLCIAPFRFLPVYSKCSPVEILPLSGVWIMSRVLVSFPPVRTSKRNILLAAHPGPPFQCYLRVNRMFLNNVSIASSQGV